MKLYSKIAEELSQFNMLVKSMDRPSAKPLVVGLSSVHKAHFISAILQSARAADNPMLVVTHDEPSARALVDDINAMLGDTLAFLYAARDFALRHGEVASREYEQIRLDVLSRLQSGECKIVVATIDALMQCTIPAKYLKERSFILDKAKSCDLKELQKSLHKAGYENREQVEGTCQFSVRGGIIDIFPPGYSMPVRAELWGDQIDTMSFFDLQTQRRTESIDVVSITPACEVLFDSPDELADKIETLAKKQKNEKAAAKLLSDAEILHSGMTLGTLDKYITLVYDTPATLFDYIGDTYCFVSEYTAVKERAKTYQWQQQEDIKILLEEGEIVKSLCELDKSFSYIMNKLDGCRSAYLDTFAHTNSDISFSELITISPIQTSGFGGEIKYLKEDVVPLLEQGYCVVVLAGTRKAAQSLTHDLKAEGMPAEYAKDQTSLTFKKIIVMQGSLSGGMEYPEAKVSVITTGRRENTAKKHERFKKGKQLKSLADLEKGDLVVHVAHGIGVFDGINKLEIQGITKDYIKISYAGTDTLYVPVTQLDLVSKYIGPREDSKVKLNRLNSAEWGKTRARVKQAVEEMAAELILLYAKRMEVKGFPFSEDTEWQKDFEQRFPFIETDDQLRSVEEIKEDMEKPVPMDRVLCGDVGFGKTEVAMRACFKAVMDGKQVAVLCPTTILAWQHYQSFLTRFEGFPINIEVLSRFRTAKQQKEIVKKLKEGNVDIIIGTHRLVQKDIEFKDLGLAIVDEEQRFGVRHKERFKELFTQVDMLTLSATPIPRTLNMAVSGIRDMSTIEQAPQDRHPVQTYVMEHDMNIIGDAIKKEIRRGGQCYYIHNKIDTIEQCAARVLAYVPEARIAVAHGRMDEKEITEVWRQLIDHEIDVLICTTIIETGVDVANCNTLIIENADRMGLSQLYQLRGRVGRSSRRAFAYFTFTRGKVLTEIANKRLSAIREFTKFGSGFRIAMRDLEIRGAGNILGERQHGHMEAVGYDMYIRLLSEAIDLKKGNPQKPQTYECLIDLRMDAHIPEDYIESTAGRIDIYKKIAAIKTLEDKLDVIDEMIDRFGEPPEGAISLTEIALLRNTLASYGFEEINEKPKGMMLYQNRLDMETASCIKSAFLDRASIIASGRPCIMIKRTTQNQSAIDLLKEVTEVLRS